MLNTIENRTLKSGRNKKNVTAGPLVTIVFVLAAALASVNCYADPEFVKNPTPIKIFFNEPGQDHLTGVDKKIDGELVQLINEALVSVDLVAYNLGRQSIIDALLSAQERGIRVRFVGDIDEAFTGGYQKIIHSDIE